MEVPFILEIVNATLKQYQSKPNEHFRVQPDPNDGLKWHFLITGLGQPFEGGEYYGRIEFSPSYPKDPPDVIITTPNGRFDTNTKIEAFTAEEWKKNCSISRLIDRLVEGMEGKVLFSKGILNTDDNTIMNLAQTSRFINKTTNTVYKNIFCAPKMEDLSSGSPRYVISEKLENDYLLKDIIEFLRSVLPEMFGVPENTISLPKMEIKPSEGKAEKKDSLPIVKLLLDFSGWEYLTQNYWGITQESDLEKCREKIRELIVAFLDSLMDFGYSRKKRFIFSEVNFSHTDASMRAIFNGSCNGRPVHRETEIEVLNMSYTNTSPQALLSLHRLRNLRELYLDHCPALIKAGKQVFEKISKKDPIPNIELLSVVETSSNLSHKWLSELQLSMPNLSKVYFTQKRGTKILGWQDVILMQTMRKPQLLPCGHIGDKGTLETLGYCSLDRKIFSKQQLLPLNPKISFLVKEHEDKWCVQIVDVCRQPLDAKVLYHTCGSFYNSSSIIKFYGDEFQDGISEEIILKLKDKKCIECNEKLDVFRICFPHSVETSTEEVWEELKDVGAYSVYQPENESRKRRKE